MIGTVDSSNLLADTTAGGNGPISYTLPQGFSTLGAQVSHDSQMLYLLISNGSQCQLMLVQGNTSDGVAGLVTVDSEYACSLPLGSGDISFLDGSAGTTDDDAYLIADGADVLTVPAGGGTPTSTAIQSPSGTPQIMGLAQAGSGTNSVLFGVDGASASLVTIDGSGAETVVQSLPVTPQGSTSLDFSTASGALYLMTNGLAYVSGNPQASAFTLLGAPTTGTVSLVVAGSAFIGNSAGGSGSGAIDPLALLGLGGLALARWRRRPAKPA